MALFASAALKPPPSFVFEHDRVVEAMRLMQQSGHVGRDSRAPSAARGGPAETAPAKAFAADPDRTHLIIGGLGGFGLAAAEWLVDHGARRLALVGRSGAATEPAREAVAALARRGVEVRVAALDVADAEATGRFLADLATVLPPLAGVMHAAMALDDVVAANIDESAASQGPEAEDRRGREPSTA